MNTQDLAIQFQDKSSWAGFNFDTQLIPGDSDVLQVIVAGFEEFPIHVIVSETQILAITYLWAESEVNPGKRVELMETLLEMNIPVPLSSFSKIGDRYVIFGALAISSDFNDICHEVVTLAENAAESLEAMEDFLQ